MLDKLKSLFVKQAEDNDISIEELITTNLALQDALYMMYTDKEKTILNFHAIIAAIVIQNGGELTLTQGMLDTAANKEIDFKYGNNDKDLIITLKDIG